MFLRSMPCVQWTFIQSAYRLIERWLIFQQPRRKWIGYVEVLYHRTRYLGKRSHYASPHTLIVTKLFQNIWNIFLALGWSSAAYHVSILLLGTLSKISVSYSIQRLHLPLAGSLLHKGEAEVQGHCEWWCRRESCEAGVSAVPLRLLLVPFALVLQKRFYNH